MRGEGLLLALVWVRTSGRRLVARALQRGLLLNAARPNLLRFMPALNVTDGEIDTMLERLETVLKDSRKLGGETAWKRPSMLAFRAVYIFG